MMNLEYNLDEEAITNCIAELERNK